MPTSVGWFCAFTNWAWGISGRVGLPSYQPVMWQDVRAYQASIQRALEHDFTHAGSCHGGWHELSGGAKSELRESLRWLLGLGRLDALGYAGDFIRRHPGIFLRFVREQLAART